MGSVTGLGVSAGILLCTPLAVALKGCVAPRTYSAVYGCEIKHFGRAIKQEHSFYHLLEPSVSYAFMQSPNANGN